VEMSEAANILHNATEQSLVLMDEIGRGTSTWDGLALAWAIARALLTHNRSLTLFATHYFELTALSTEHPTLANVHVEATEHGGRVVFLHKVKPGPASQSYGIQVAQLAGVPAGVLREARSRLRTLEGLAAGHGDSMQGGLFAEPVDLANTTSGPTLVAASAPLAEALAKLDPDALTPREALDLLYQLKRLANEN
ncbi:MAG: DNA mismatch repair protein MutS, partial [Betaproteobacteria bacterium]|nr:DNA mismatch repair protein MutS [Betaproteobacteria bacterium]